MSDVIACEPQTKQKFITTRRAGAVIIFEGQAVILAGKTNPNDVILCKGHIEKGEENATHLTALREAYEECGALGVLASAHNPLTVTSHFEKGMEFSFTDQNGIEITDTLPDELILTDWWIIKATEMVPSPEGRNVHVCFFEDALHKLTYPTHKDVLRRARIIGAGFKPKPKVWGIPYQGGSLIQNGLSDPPYTVGNAQYLPPDPDDGSMP